MGCCHAAPGTGQEKPGCSSPTLPTFPRRRMSPGLCGWAKTSLPPLPCHHRHSSVLRRPRSNKNLLNKVNFENTSDTTERTDTDLTGIVSGADSPQLLGAVAAAKRDHSAAYKPEEPPTHPREQRTRLSAGATAEHPQEKGGWGQGQWGPFEGQQP